MDRERDMTALQLPEQAPERYGVFAVPEIPEIHDGDELGEVVARHMEFVGGVEEGDVYVIASKIISKAEGRIVDLSTVEPSKEARAISEQTGKPAEVVELILRESESHEIKHGRVIIAKHKRGFILTSGGVDRMDSGRAALLPEDPDASAQRIMKSIERLTGKKVSVVIADSEGRPDRAGAGTVALGVAGIEPLRISESEVENGKKKIADETYADFLAGAASVILGQRGKNTPVVCIRGLEYEHAPDANLASIIH